MQEPLTSNELAERLNKVADKLRDIMQDEELGTHFYEQLHDIIKEIYR